MEVLKCENFFRIRKNFCLHRKRGEDYYITITL